MIEAINVYNEKSLHAALKTWYAGDDGAGEACRRYTSMWCVMGSDRGADAALHDKAKVTALSGNLTPCAGAGSCDLPVRATTFAAQVAEAWLSVALFMELAVFQDWWRTPIAVEVVFTREISYGTTTRAGAGVAMAGSPTTASCWRSWKPAVSRGPRTSCRCFPRRWRRASRRRTWQRLWAGREDSLRGWPTACVRWGC